ncbi:MAG TPA: hypothetical protein VFU22_27650 [Roseiflexaceae bacterium]|nr:hypothetical protein [Roseiflexaceae bacterium]
MDDNIRSARQLDHVLWIGGTPCSGKTSIAHLLSEKYPLQIYHCDEAFDAHKLRMRATRKILSLSWDELWTQPVDILLADVFAIYREEFQLIRDDLQALPPWPPILAEGMALLPDLVAPALPSPNRAVWLIPTPDFQRERYPKRGAWVQDILQQCADPDLAFRNWMDRDIESAQIVADEAAKRGLRIIQVDGRQSIASIAATVEEQFHPFLGIED